VAFAGSNQHFYAGLKQAVVDIGGTSVHLAPTGVRVYLNDAKYPSSGPWDWKMVPDGARGCVSIRPQLWELINGHLDHNLRAFLMAAPKGPTSLLGLWHEASGDGPGYGPGNAYKDYFSLLNKHFKRQGGASGLLRDAQHYVQNKAHIWGANVKVGAIEVVSKTDPSMLAGTLDRWMATDLDFYACDIYDSKTADAHPAKLLDAFKAVSDKRTHPHSATIGIAETNSRFPGRRPYWFSGAWSWLKSAGFTSSRTCFLTYWNAHGLESGGWLPADWATIDALYSIFAESSP
jgi:hypothetical protein